MALEETPAHDRQSIIRPGSNCWAYETASNVSFLVDAAEYFSAVEAAILQARKSVFIVAWDIKTYTLLRNQAFPDQTITLIELLKTALQRNPELNIHILCWKRSLIFSNDREFFAPLKWKVMGHPRLHFHLDSTQPLGASHHQKIVVIDENLAFCGGMDITDQRWDTPCHSNHVYRRDKNGQSYKPYHDVQMAVLGAPAVCLAKLFRERWALAGGGPLAVHQPMLPGSWPDFLISDLENVRVAIARTIPETAHEVAKLGAEAVMAAKRFIYIENQYLSSVFNVDLLERRLHEPEGPELIIILPKRYPGLLENAVIGVTTGQAISRLRSADRYGRLGIFYLETINDPNHDYVKVHSKVLIVDNRFLKIGSANLSERSMGVDTECDLAIEAVEDGRVADAIEAFLHRLLAEHNDCSVEDVKLLLEQENSILEAISIMRQEPTCRIKFLEAPTETERVPALMKVVIDPLRPWKVLFIDSLRELRRFVLLRVLSWGSLMILIYIFLKGVLAK